MLDIHQLCLNRQSQMYRFHAQAQAASLTLIRGASGVGKSTLLDCIAGFAEPHAGLLSWNGKPFQLTPIHERPLSLLQQGDNLFPHLTILENICLGAQPNLRIGKDIQARALKALEQVGLQDIATQRPSAVSGGQAQRAGLARALLRHQYIPRPILLLDEPYSALDSDSAYSIHMMVRTLCTKHQLCVLLVAHREMECDQIWEIHNNNGIVEIST